MGKLKSKLKTSLKKNSRSIAMLLIDTPYEVMQHKWRSFRFFLDITITVLYSVYVLLGLALREKDAYAFWFIGAAAALSAIIIVILIIVYTGKNERYAKSSARQVALTLQNVLRLLNLFVLILIVLQTPGNAWEEFMRITSWVLLVFASLGVLSHTRKLLYRLFNQKKYQSKKEKARIRSDKIKKFVTATQDFFRTKMTRDEMGTLKDKFKSLWAISLETFNIKPQKKDVLLTETADGFSTEASGDGTAQEDYVVADSLSDEAPDETNQSTPYHAADSTPPVREDETQAEALSPTENGED